MKCDQFREQIAERLAGELVEPQAHEFDAHEQACAACRVALSEWQRLEGWLRAGWPSEDVPPMGLIVPPRASHTWFDTTRVWFARASTALVVASLVALVLLRPSVEWDRTGVRLAFGPGGPGAEPAPAAAVTQQQVEAWVQAAVNKAMTQPAPASVTTREGAEAARWGQVGVQLKMLEQSQAFLWQQLQQQGLYLESLWRGPAGRLEPASGIRYQRQ